MNSLHIDAGQFRHQVIVLANQKTDDAFGGFESNWVEQNTIWAKILPANMAFNIRAGMEEPLTTHIVELRQPLVIAAGMRLNATQSNRLFTILSVFDPDETRRYWRCACRLEESP